MINVDRSSSHMHYATTNDNTYLFNNWKQMKEMLLIHKRRWQPKSVWKEYSLNQADFQCIHVATECENVNTVE